MRKNTKKSPKEVNQSNSPSSPGSSEGGVGSRVKSKLETFFNKVSSKLSSKPPSRSTSPIPSTLTGNPVRETPIGKSPISSVGARLITLSQIPQRLPLRMVRLKCHPRPETLHDRTLPASLLPVASRVVQSELATLRLRATHQTDRRP